MEIERKATPVVPQRATESEAETVSLTDWKQFEKAGLIPYEAICQEYPPIHTSVTGCHTRLLVKRAEPNAPINPKTKRPTQTGSAQSMLEHTAAGHGGGFLVRFKRAEAGATPWLGWAQLRKSGVEITDLRCDWCEKSEDRVHAGSLLSHNKPHKGRGRGMKACLDFRMTLSYAKSEEETEGDDD